MKRQNVEEDDEKGTIEFLVQARTQLRLFFLRFDVLRRQAAEKAQSNDEKVFKIPPNRQSSELAQEKRQLQKKKARCKTKPFPRRPKRGPVAEKTTSAIGCEVLNEKVQHLVEGLNRKRNRDAEALSG